MNKINKFIVGTTMVGLSLAALPAMAGHITGAAFNEQSFSFNGSAYGGGTATNLNFIDFSYLAEIDGTGNTFAETGGGFFSSFRSSLSGAPISGTGLNSAFNMYALFQATGTQVITGSVVELAFTTFDVSFYIDQNRDTAFNNVTIGGTTTTITDESILFSNTAFRSDDVEILSGSLSVGGGHIFGGLANGDFDVLFNVNYFNPTVWGGAAFTNGSSILGDFNGVNTRIEGVALPGTNFVDGLVVGSGNTSFQVPAPATLMLFSIGLLGLGGASRRRNSHSS